VRRARVSSNSGAPQAMSFSAPTTAGASGGCYSSSYSPQSQTYSAPITQTYSAPTTFGAGEGCYSSSYAPQSQAYMVAPPQQYQVTPAPQSRAMPSLPSKTVPLNQEYTPSRLAQNGAMVTPGVHRSIRRIQPHIESPERRPTAKIACGGQCCGGEGDCECGENCGCGWDKTGGLFRDGREGCSPTGGLQLCVGNKQEGENVHAMRESPVG
jgi:hypothetical protein